MYINRNLIYVLAVQYEAYMSMSIYEASYLISSPWYATVTYVTVS